MIGIVVRLDKAIGGIEVSEAALIGAVERGGALFDDKALLRWLDGGGLGGRLSGVEIGSSDPSRTIVLLVL